METSYNFRETRTSLFHSTYYVTKVTLYTSRVHKGEWKYSFHSFLNWALDGGGWSASGSGRSNPQEGAHWMGSWVSPSACLDALAKRAIAGPLPGIEHCIVSVFHVGILQDGLDRLRFWIETFRALSKLLWHILGCRKVLLWNAIPLRTDKDCVRATGFG